MNSTHLGQGSKQPSSLDKGKIRLYSNRFCPYAQRVVLVLDAKRIPYEVVNINLIDKPDWMFEKSPLGKIPALELDTGDVLYESIVIADYLDERYHHQGQLHAKNPLQKAKDQLLLRQFNKVINSMHKTLLIGRIGSDEADCISAGLNSLENELSQRKGPFFGGSKPGMLDYMIWPWCERSDLLKLFGQQFVLRKDKYKRLMEWRETMLDEETVKKSCLDLDTHVKYFYAYRAGGADYDSILNSKN